MHSICLVVWMQTTVEQSTDTLHQDENNRSFEQNTATTTIQHLKLANVNQTRLNNWLTFWNQTIQQVIK